MIDTRRETLVTPRQAIDGSDDLSIAPAKGLGAVFGETPPSACPSLVGALHLGREGLCGGRGSRRVIPHDGAHDPRIGSW